MPIHKTLNKGKVPVKIFTNDVDSAAMTFMKKVVKQNDKNRKAYFVPLLEIL